MTTKQSKVFVNGRMASADPTFFRTFFNVAKGIGKIKFNYCGEKRKSNSYWCMEPFSELIIRGWESGLLGAKKIQLYHTFGRKTPPQELFEMSIQEEKILPLGDLGTHFESVFLVDERGSNIASVYHKKICQGEILVAGEGVSYGGQFRGLNPETGRLDNSRPWMERIVESYFKG